jgi:hypothetical protein
VTERQWLNCKDPAKMVHFLEPMPLFRNDPDPGQEVRPRKFRLFACACCRRIQDLLVHPEVRAALEVAERYADGQATDKEREEAASHFNPFPPRPERAAGKRTGEYPAFEAKAMGSVASALWFDRGGSHGTKHGAGYASRAVVEATGLSPLERTGATSRAGARSSEKAIHCALLRDIFGNPFQPVTLDATWLTWNGDTVRKLAEAIYNERDFDRLQILADALEDAGCAEEQILTHLRDPGPHVRGCWPLDLLTARQ